MVLAPELGKVSICCGISNASRLSWQDTSSDQHVFLQIFTLISICTSRCMHACIFCASQSISRSRYLAQLLSISPDIDLHLSRTGSHVPLLASSKSPHSLVQTLATSPPPFPAVCSSWMPSLDERYHPARCRAGRGVQVSSGRARCAAAHACRRMRRPRQHQLAL